MRKIREVLRLKFELRLSDGQIARTIGSARSTVQECVRRAKEAGLGWPLPSECGEAQLHARLYRRSVPLSRTPAPDFAVLHAELRRPGVTRLLLWQEYKAAQPDGWQYSVFCDQYRRWLATQDAVLRQHPTPGDKCFVDYAGDTVGIVDRMTGEIRQAQIFVAVLGASSYTFAEATWTQQLPDWIGSHVRALQFFGGVPRAIVPTISRAGSPRRIVTSPSSIRPIRSWPSIMAWRFCRRACASRGTKPRSKWRCRSCSVGFWRDCVIARSSRWPNSMRPSRRCCAI